MGFLDKAKGKLDDLTEQHPDKVESYSDQAIEHGGDAVDSATGGMYADKVDQGQTRADDAIGER